MLLRGGENIMQDDNKDQYGGQDKEKNKEKGKKGGQQKSDREREDQDMEDMGGM